MARHPNRRRGQSEPPPTVLPGMRTTAFLVVGAAWFAMMAGLEPGDAAVRGLRARVRLLERGPDARLRHLRARAGAVAAAVRAALRPARPAAGDGGRASRPRRSGCCCSPLAGSLAWLFAARAVQGLAVGMISGAAAAALVELDPAPAGGPRGAVRRARPGRRQRLRAADRRDAGRVGARAARAAVRRCSSRLGVAATVAALAIPEPGRVVRRPHHGRAPERPARDPRAVRARERDRRRRVGRRGAVPLGRAVLRRRAARHLEPRAARRGQRASCSRRRAWPRSRRAAPARTRRMQALGLRPARARPARARARLPDPLAARPARRRPARRHRPRHRVPRRAGPAQPRRARPTAAARSTPPSTR